MSAPTEGTLGLTGWRRRLFVLVYWPLVFVLLCGVGVMVGAVQQASGQAPQRPLVEAYAWPGSGSLTCVQWLATGQSSSGSTQSNIRCNYAGDDVIKLRWNTTTTTVDCSGANLHADVGGVWCQMPFTSGNAGNTNCTTCYVELYQASGGACYNIGNPTNVSNCRDEPRTVVYSKGVGNVPPAFDEADVVCLAPSACLLEEDMCENLAFSGPLPGMPWNGGESITITVTIPEGVSWPNLYFYWPGTSLHPDRWWDPETGYPREPQYDYPLLVPGDVEVPRFFVAYPDRWAYPENPYEPLTWAADGTETIKIRRLPGVRDGTVGELKIACAFALADGWHLSVRSWDGSEPATPTDFRECQGLAIDRPNWAEGDPNYPDDPGPWRVFARGGAAFGPVDVEVWDPETGVWVAWLDDLTLTAGEVVEEPEAVPTVALDDPDSYSFRCTDADGTLTGGTLGEVSPEKWADGSKESCTASGIGVAPSSWVPGLVKMGSCVTRKLFVPSDVEMQRIRVAGAEASHRAPISFIAEPGGVLISAFSDAPATIEAHRDDCLLIVDVSTLLDGVDDVSACPHSLETSGSSLALSRLRSVLVTVWWLAFAWFLWSSTRRVMNL